VEGYQFKMLMIEPQPSRAKELQAMNRPRIKEAVGILTGHTTLMAHMFKLELTRQDSRLCGDKKVVCILCVIVQHWSAKDTQPWVIMF
jgi:chemotaxis protein CheY-P-specific phosphatase CheC